MLDLSHVAACDLAGAAFLLAIEDEHEGETALEGASPRIEALVERARTASGTPQRPGPPAVLTFGQIAGAGLEAAGNGIAFLGEAVIALFRLPARSRMLRGDDLLRYADQAGVRSMPLIILLGFLIGLILAFQSAVPMRRFGADLYVANLVSISLLRELGPLLAAVILAGRTGSAFAAEIGTMKVNEEVDALITMGLDPMTMLVLPRLIAVMLVMPAMTLMLDLAGLAGMTTVMRAFGFPLVTVAHQVASAARVGRPDRGAAQGHLLRRGCRGNRLPGGTRHRGRPARRWSGGDRRGGRRDCLDRSAGRAVRGDPLQAEIVRVSADPVVDATPVIRAEDVSQRFGSRTIFRDVSFTVATGRGLRDPRRLRLRQIHADEAVDRIATAHIRHDRNRGPSHHGVGSGRRSGSRRCAGLALCSNRARCSAR